MEEQHRLRLVGGHDGETAVFTLLDDDNLCRLRCDYRDRSIESAATDFFQALCDLRNVLAENGFMPFCYGASLNVHPSGMARDMGQGLKAYRMTMGRHARREDLVDIFSKGPDVVPASVAAQEQFWRDWLATPRA
ncbi:hypothetical protein HL666_06440 [Bradyrhizobium sp. 83002]|uniref:hypothetical protein n=1 Tax=Bradyrhizobium aeschynomenes TaxID=2734909 RepID=UPI0015571A0B|nr:hypothetical protein [Bradyrhizobium aeschynomenes]NPU10388.1 hypothetical protein [Bradyrhizobium aeschynomenes]